MKLQPYISYYIFDPYSLHIETVSPEIEANSLIKNWIQRIYSHWGYTAQNQTDTGGTSRSLSATTPFYAAATQNTTTYGIVVGTGTDAVTLADTKLQTQVTTNFYHYSTSVGYEQFTTGSRIVITRGFQNNTGDSVAIKEVGLYAITTSYYFLIDRTLKDITVPDDKGLNLTYVMSYTFA